MHKVPGLRGGGRSMGGVRRGVRPGLSAIIRSGITTTTIIGAVPAPVIAVFPWGLGPG